MKLGRDKYVIDKINYYAYFLGSKNEQDMTRFILENSKFKHGILLHGLTQLLKLHVPKYLFRSKSVGGFISIAIKNSNFYLQNFESHSSCAKSKQF